MPKNEIFSNRGHFPDILMLSRYEKMINCEVFSIKYLQIWIAVTKVRNLCFYQVFQSHGAPTLKSPNSCDVIVFQSFRSHGM